MTLDIPNGTDDVLTSDTHLIQSFANLNALKQDGARTAIVGAKGAHVTDSEGNQLIDGIGGLWCVNVGHGRDEIIDAITDQLRTLDYYSTFYNFTHPAAAAAGLANIHILESEDIPGQVKTTGKVFENALRDLDMVGEVRGSHFMMGLEFVKNKDTHEEFEAEAMVGTKVSQSAQARGLIARALGNILILSPTLIMDEAMIGEVEGILRESIEEVSDAMGT